MSGATMKELSADVKTMEVSKYNIYQRMLKAQTLIKTVGKNLSVDTGNQKYKAVSERDILDAVKLVEEKCGIYSYPYKRTAFEVKTTSNAKGFEKQWLRLEVVYRFVNVDNPSDFIEVQTYGDGVDSMDKAPGKAMTYADKYALMKAYKISTGDDPDTEPSEPQQDSKKADVKPQKTDAKQKQEPRKTIEQLAIEWQTCRNKLFDLGVDVHSENIIQWVANKTGYPNQELDLNDPIKMEKVICAYEKLIAGKEKNNG